LDAGPGILVDRARANRASGSNNDYHALAGGKEPWTMAVVILLTWSGITQEQYEEARRRVGWEREVPQGGVFHAAWFTAQGLHIANVWDTADNFQRFAAQRLLSVVKGELGFEGQPEITVHEAHAVFVPALVEGGP
jgi:hypothetical protein